MANDREVLRMIWQGKVAICFQADSNEIMALQQPENFYLMVPRLSYLPLQIDKIKKYFSRFIPKEQTGDQSNIWFDYQGTPLKMHYPVGLLYDLLHVEKEGIPWILTIHFSKFPDTYLVKFSTKDDLEAYFMASLKEADVLKHRGQVVSTMQKKDHNQLWLGLVNDKFDQFWAINRRLMETNNDEQDAFKYIPVRFYNEHSSTYIQKLISPIGLEKKKTISDVINEISSPTCEIVGFRTHGIALDKDIQLQWASEHLSYPDNFLHLHLQQKIEEN